MNQNLAMFGQMANQGPPPMQAPMPPGQGPQPMQGQQPMPMQGHPQLPPQIIAALMARMGQQPQAQKFSPQELAALGRYGDTTIAHLTPGEIQVPPEVQTPKVLATLKHAFQKKGIPPAGFVAGSPISHVNPKTGVPEYNSFGWLPAAGSVVGGILGAIFGEGVGAAPGAAIGGAAGSLAENIIEPPKNAPLNPTTLPLPTGFTNPMTPTSQLPPPGQILGQNTYSGPTPTRFPGDLTRYGFGPGFNFFQQPGSPQQQVSPAQQPTQVPLGTAFSRQF